MRIYLLNKSICYFKDLFQGHLCDEACPALPSIIGRVGALPFVTTKHTKYAIFFFSYNTILHILMCTSCLLLEFLDGRNTFILLRAHHSSQFVVGTQKPFYE